MCVVSMVMDHYDERWRKQYPTFYPSYPNITFPPVTTPIVPRVEGPLPQPTIIKEEPVITREEFNQLKKEIQDLKELLQRAQNYDKIHNEPDCHNDEKIATIKKFIEMVGLNAEDILGNVKN